MKIPIKHLLAIPDIDKYQLTFNRKSPEIAAIYEISEKGIRKTYYVTVKYLTTLQSRGVTVVSINANRDLINQLKEKYPENYPTPDGEKSVSELFNQAQEYEMINLKSRKKRKIQILEDIYTEDINIVTGSRDILIEYGSFLNTKNIAVSKKKVSPTQKIFYNDIEKGILIFVPDVKFFKLKVDLFALLAPINTEIYDAENVVDAINIYKTKFPRLVIIGKLSESIDSKRLFLELLEYDPFMKKLSYEESPASHRHLELKRIKKTYYSGYAEIIELEKREKESLPEEIKKNVFEIIQKLQTNFSFDAYIEVAYAIKQFGRMFKVAPYWHMLHNVKKRLGY